MARKEESRERIQSLISALVEGDIDLQSWVESTAGVLKDLHVRSYVETRGGKDSMRQRDYGLEGQILRTQYDFLRGVVADLQSGNTTLEELRARMNMYVNAVSLSESVAKREVALEQGKTSEHRILGTTDRSCPECLFFANVGWSPIGSLPLPTQQCSCLSNCRCQIEYR